MKTIVLAATMSAVVAVEAQPGAIDLRSPAFKNNETLPLAYTGYGDFRSPPLAWSGVPRGTRELALIVDDPDVPLEQFSIHWLLYNIPANVTAIAEGAKPANPKDGHASPLEAASQGLNALKRLGYLPPRPFGGSGVHHYTFALYALDADLPLKDGLSKNELLAAMKGHIIGEGKLVAVFERWQEKR
jgi:Raf kinase inhibitor-like YbhB/YbcL family protein